MSFSFFDDNLPRHAAAILGLSTFDQAVRISEGEPLPPPGDCAPFTSLIWSNPGIISLPRLRVDLIGPWEAAPGSRFGHLCEESLLQSLVAFALRNDRIDRCMRLDGDDDLGPDMWTSFAWNGTVASWQGLVVQELPPVVGNVAKPLWLPPLGEEGFSFGHLLDGCLRGGLGLLSARSLHPVSTPENPTERLTIAHCMARPGLAYAGTRLRIDIHGPVNFPDDGEGDVTRLEVLVDTLCWLPLIPTARICSAGWGSGWNDIYYWEMGDLGQSKWNRVIVQVLPPLG